MEIFIYIMYKYYESGGRRQRIAYESAILNLVGILIVNIVTILGISGQLDTFANSVSVYPLWLCGLVSVTLLYFILLKVFKKDYITSLVFTEVELRAGRRKLISYTVITFVALIAVAFLRPHG